MPSANLLKQWIWTGVVFVGLGAGLGSPARVLAASQTCQPGSLCTIGEFVYTDAAVAITDATCQFTSFTPSGQSFVAAVPLTGTADGWYAYSFTPDQNTAVGTYPSQLCCQTSENDLCIDKSFTITPAPTPGLSSTDISQAVWNATVSGNTNPGSFGSKVDELQNNPLSAADIWSFSGRTLTGFGTLVGDIVTNVWSSATRSLTNTQNITDGVWNANPDNYQNPDSIAQKINTTTNLSAQEVWEYQNRSLTSFGNLVSNIWSADNRTATDPTGATAAGLEVLEREIQTAQALIQELARQPGSNPDGTPATDYSALLETKLDDTKKYLTQVANNLEIVSTKLGLLAIKWDQLSDTDRTQELEQILALLGPLESTDMSTLIGQLNWFALNWPKTSTTALYQDVVSLRTDINDFITSIQISPADTDQAQTINQLFSQVTTIKTGVGDISQPASSPTLYGHYKTNRDLAAALASQLRILQNTLDDWDHLSLDDRDALVTELARNTGLLNRFSPLKPLLAPVSASPGFLNQLKTVITANQAVLALTTTDPLVLNWIGQNATSFHTFVYNPSRTKTQSATIDYYLPTELTTEHLTNTPANLTAIFDPNQNAVHVTGSRSLDPQTSSLETIQVANIWEIRQLDLDNLRAESTTLLASLEKSPLYPQATALHGAILQALDTIATLQAQTTTPEAQIKAYRQIQILRQTVTDQLQQLTDLANSDKNTSSLMGFVGGIQAVAVWGMIVIVIAGFIFLSLYMRALYQQTQPQPELALSLPLSGPAPTRIVPDTTTTTWDHIHLPFSFNLSGLSQRRFMATFVLLSSVLLTAVVLRHQTPSPAPNPAAPLVVAPLEPSQPEPIEPPEPVNRLASPQPTAEAGPHSILISPPNLDSQVNLHRLPSATSSVLATISLEEPATIATQSGRWVQVTLTGHDPALTGWINRDQALIIPE